MEKIFEELTATQLQAVKLASEYPDDEAAVLLERSKPDFRGIIEDACISIKVGGDTYDDRRTVICNLYSGKTNAPSQPDSALNGADTTPGGTAKPPQAQEPEMPEINIDAVKKKLKKVPGYMIPALAVMSKGGKKADVAKAMKVKESTASMYMSKINGVLGLAGRSDDVKISVYKQLEASGDDKPNGSATSKPKASAGNGAGKAPAAKPVRKSGAEDEDLVVLDHFAESLGGGEIANVIKRVLAKVKEQRPAIDAALDALQKLKA